MGGLIKSLSFVFITNKQYAVVMSFLSKFVILIGVAIGLVGIYDIYLLAQPDIVNRGFYAFIEMENLLTAVVFVWLGIGSKIGKRWAHHLLLILSWFWLLGGFSFFMLFYHFTINFLDTVGLIDLNSRIAPIFIKSLAVVFLVLVYVIFPGALILLSNGWLNRTTFKDDSAQKSWTDKCPLPVLALNVIFGWGMVSLLLMLVFLKPVVPFFGQLFIGFPADLIILVLVLGLGWTGWGIYRLRLWALQLTMVSLLVVGFSFLMTFSKINFLNFFLKTGVPITPLLDIGLWHFLTLKPPIIEVNVFIICTTCISLAYTIFLKKYFNHV